ncbi:MAG: hypothetical protein ACI4OZ_09810, partial [Akkermansia sp.]
RLSEARYKEIKGWGDCDPYIKVTRNNDNSKEEEEMCRELAPVNCRSFTVHPDKCAFYIWVDGERIGVLVGDDDVFSADQEGFSHKISTVEEAGSMKSSTYTTSDGTTITLRYKFE